MFMNACLDIIIMSECMNHMNILVCLNDCMRVVVISLGGAGDVDGVGVVVVDDVVICYHMLQHCYPTLFRGNKFNTIIIIIIFISGLSRTRQSVRPGQVS